MYMSEWMDEGDILSIEEVEIWENDTTPDIFKKFEKIWPKLLINSLKWVLDWKIKWIEQDDFMATYCSKIKKQDWEIFFDEENCEEIYNKYKAYYPWPGIFSYYEWKKLNFEEVKIKNYFWNKKTWEIEKVFWGNYWIICEGKKILILKKVKLEWKKSMDILSFINWDKEFLKYKFIEKDNEFLFFKIFYGILLIPLILTPTIELILQKIQWINKSILPAEIIPIYAWIICLLWLIYIILKNISSK
jgi:methionyl-tRNA formyltransferase